jgi:hypothetical protein
MTEPDTLREAPVRRVTQLRVPQFRLHPGVRDVLLVVLGAALALAAEQWRDNRAEHRRVALAIGGIRAELVENRDRVERARAHHLQVADTLEAYAARRSIPPDRILYGGVLRPALPLSTAWQAARETGVLADLPYPLVLALGPVYEEQARYRAIGDALAQSMMVDVQHQGVRTFFQTNFANFVAIDRDFANREMVLDGDYARALATLDSASRDPASR